MSPRLVLCGGSLPRASFRDFVAAAADAGFDAVTIWPHLWRRAQRHEGLTPATMRALLDEHGVGVTDVDTCWDWLPAADVATAPDTPVRPRWRREQLFEIAVALGAETVIAAHLTGGEVDDDQAAEGLAGLCDDAAEHGLRIALEFVPFTGISTLDQALRIVRAAGRTNGGLMIDTAHHARSGGAPADLERVPASALLGVQLADGPRRAPDDLLDEAMYHRALPGDGELDLTAALRSLPGVPALPVGVEAYRRAWESSSPHEIARRMAEAARTTIASAAA